MITLKRLFLINSISCIFFGVFFIAVPATISNFLSLDNKAPDLMITTIGIGLVLNGLHLIWTSLKSEASRALTLYFSVGDILWVILTLYLILTETWITTQEGIIISTLVAAFVGSLGIFQLKVRKLLVGAIDHSSTKINQPK